MLSISSYKYFSSRPLRAPCGAHPWRVDGRIPPCPSMASGRDRVGDPRRQSPNTCTAGPGNRIVDRWQPVGPSPQPKRHSPAGSRRNPRTHRRGRSSPCCGPAFGRSTHVCVSHTMWLRKQGCGATFPSPFTSVTPLYLVATRSFGGELRGAPLSVDLLG
jgi:hypothetical protein